MFTAEHRDQVRDRVLELARSDPRVTAGALTGSTALGTQDAWSDVDIAFGIAEDNNLLAVLRDWTVVLEREYGLLDHFDLHSGAAIYRVFLLLDGLELDVAVTPEREFGARGPRFRAIFGTAHQLEVTPQPASGHLIGLAWHHVLHARACIERGKPWQAEYWISGIRDHVLALACIRLGEDAVYGRGIDRLPAAATDPLAETLVRSLDTQELRRSLAATTACLIGELEKWDPIRCVRLARLLHEVGTTEAFTGQQRLPDRLSEQ